MNDRFDTVIWPFIGRHEGGFTTKLNDGAGATAYGVTLSTLSALWKLDADWMRGQGMPTHTRGLTPAQAQAIARRFYFELPDLQLLPPPVDLVMVDWLFHGGPAIKALNRLVGVTSSTLKASTIERSSINPHQLAQKLVNERRAYLQGLKTWSRFAKNWSKRLEDLESSFQP